MAAELSDIATQLAVLQRSITGVTMAFDFSNVPNALMDSLLPCYVNVPGPAQYEAYGGGSVMEKRVWRMMLFVTPIQNPSDVATKATVVEPFFRATATTFADAQKLSDLVGVDLAWIGSDDGLDVLEHGGALYAGIEFRIEISTTYNLAMSTSRGVGSMSTRWW